CEGPRSSLAALLDYALRCVGSAFTVSVAEEQRDIAVTPAVQPAREMAAAPELKSASEVSSDHKSAPEVSSDHKSASEVSSDHKSAPEVSSDHKSAPEVSSDHKSAPEVSSVNKSASEVSSVYKSASEASPVGEAAPMPPEVSAVAVKPPKEAAFTYELSTSLLVPVQSPAAPPAPPWRAPSAPAPPPALPWRVPALPVLPQSPGPPHGPGPPTLALSRPHPTAPLDCCRSLGGILSLAFSPGHLVSSVSPPASWTSCSLYGIPLCLALWIMYAADPPMPTSRTTLAPRPYIPVCCCSDPACLTMYLSRPVNKSLRMDPLASRLPLHVTIPQMLDWIEIWGTMTGITSEAA
ncbi:hypothetical protein M9458_008199, partial [Cirrhinus mrigala]